VDVVSAPIIDQADNLEGAVLLFKDSSERKVAEDALQQDRALLKAALDGLSDAVFLRSLDGLLVLVNTAGTRLLGRPEKGLLGKDGNELFGRRAAALIEQAHQRVLATGEAQRFRCEIPVNGVERVFEVTESVGQSKEGEAAGVVAVLRDSEPLAGRAPGSSRERSMARDTRRQPTVEEMDRRLDTVRHRLETFKSEWGQGTAPEQLSEIEQQLASLSDILRGMSGLHRRRRNPSRST
jgi:PAS domain S-box-containing protein